MKCLGKVQQMNHNIQHRLSNAFSQATKSQVQCLFCKQPYEGEHRCFSPTKDIVERVVRKYYH